MVHSKSLSVVLNYTAYSGRGTKITGYTTVKCVCLLCQVELRYKPTETGEKVGLAHLRAKT